MGHASGLQMVKGNLKVNFSMQRTQSSRIETFRLPDHNQHCVKT